MNSDYLQNLRYKLQKRARRVNSTEPNVFHWALRQFWSFLLDDSNLNGLLESLESQKHLVESDVEKIFSSNSGMVFDTELENIIASYLVIKRCVEHDDKNIAADIGRIYYRSADKNETLSAYRDQFFEPLYEYLDEGIDDSQFLLTLLTKYKKKCEWFNRDALFGAWDADTKRGEKILSLNLYEYLFDQGIEFSIEPASASGEADAVSSQTGSEPLIADVKIFNPDKSKGKSYIAKGFRQVYDYTLDYNQPAGYLVIFKTCEQSLRFSLSTAGNLTPFYRHNNKTIYFVVIDVHQYEKTASKRGELKFIDLSETDLTSELEKP